MKETTGIQLGPRPGWLRRAEIARQIEALTYRTVRRVDALGVVFRSSLSFELARIGQALATMLTSPDEKARQEGARLIAEHLLDVGEKEDPGFWATDLGRAISREIGWVAIMPPKVIARNVLHVSRQAVDQMISRGELDSGGGPTVTRDSLRRAAAKRWPLDDDK